MGDPPGCVVACIWVGLHRQALLYDVQRLLPVPLRSFYRVRNALLSFVRWTGWFRHGWSVWGRGLTGRCDRTKPIISETTGAADDIHRAESSKHLTEHRASIVTAIALNAYTL